MKKKLKPKKKGAKIPMRFNKGFLKEEGEEVTIDKYWSRRISAGDVVECKEEKKESKKSKSTKKVSKKAMKEDNKEIKGDE